MNRLRLRTWLLTTLTAILAAAGNAAMLAATGFEVFSFTMFFLVPVGTLLLCLAASSGYYVGARTSSFAPATIDLAFLMLINVGLLFLVYAAEYLYISASQNALANRAGSFWHFIANHVTQTKHSMYARGLPTNAPPVAAGEAGWLLLVIRTSAALAVAKIVHSRFDRHRATKWSA